MFFRHVDFGTEDILPSPTKKLGLATGRYENYDPSPAQSFDVTRNHLDFEET